MVAQQKLGLLAKRHIRSDLADSPDIATAGKNLKIDAAAPISSSFQIGNWQLEIGNDACPNFQKLNK
jgi:hypothetical protein